MLSSHTSSLVHPLRMDITKIDGFSNRLFFCQNDIDGEIQSYVSLSPLATARDIENLQKNIEADGPLDDKLR